MVVILSHFLKEILGNVFLCFLGENKMKSFFGHFSICVRYVATTSIAERQEQKVNKITVSAH